jgi:uncharacterized glyoxalase superfamily protein PhnB
MVKLFRVILPVADIERAAIVYAKLLGSAGERVSPGRHYFDCGGTVLACYDSMADGDGPVEPCRYQPSQYLYFSVEDLDATHAAAVQLGFAIRGAGIQSMPWGERMFWSIDPFGNPVSFVASNSVFVGSAKKPAHPTQPCELLLVD